LKWSFLPVSAVSKKRFHRRDALLIFILVIALLCCMRFVMRSKDAARDVEVYLGDADPENNGIYYDVSDRDLQQELIKLLGKADFVRNYQREEVFTGPQVTKEEPPSVFFIYTEDEKAKIYSIVFGEIGFDTDEDYLKEYVQCFISECSYEYDPDALPPGTVHASIDRMYICEMKRSDFKNIIEFADRVSDIANIEGPVSRCRELAIALKRN